jgi:hypothetical protein
MKPLHALILASALVMPFATFALPSEVPHNNDCAQPWEKPSADASSYERSGWNSSVDRYFSCLNRYADLAESNRNEFRDASRKLLRDAIAKDEKGLLSEAEYAEVDSTTSRYEAARSAWNTAMGDAQDELTSWARRNGVKVTSK